LSYVYKPLGDLLSAAVLINALQLSCFVVILLLSFSHEKYLMFCTKLV